MKKPDWLILVDMDPKDLTPEESLRVYKIHTIIFAIISAIITLCVITFSKILVVEIVVITVLWTITFFMGMLWLISASNNPGNSKFYQYLSRLGKK